MIYSITEGQQAEAYKARKAKEAEENRKKEETDNKRHDDWDDTDDENKAPRGQINAWENYPTSKHNPKINGNISTEFEIADRAREYIDVAYARRNHLHDDDPNNCIPNKNRRLSYHDTQVVQDATRRHIRRHPDLFDKEEKAQQYGGTISDYKESCGIFSSIAFI